MTVSAIETYLSDALDQEACKATLVAALQSRVMTLQAQGISNLTIIAHLENLCDDAYQINDDVIDTVIDWILFQEI